MIHFRRCNQLRCKMSINVNHKLADAIRFLSIDAVEKAKSGHPGMPMGMADIATVLWRKYLQHNPKNPKWINRDRFVLSNGHGSMLLYALLHLSGYHLSIDDLKNFRQFHSKTPGHPECDYTDGVETTTGPLGQGLANGVGMALAEKLLAQQFNQPDISIIDHFIYVFAGDGCLMEGVSHEVSSLAGTLKLGKLIVFWDNNNISIDGEVKRWFSEDVALRYKAYGWQVIEAVDGHDFTAIDNAISTAQADKNRPTLICCKTNIGQGSPNKVGTHGVHGAPLGETEVTATRAALSWHYQPFEIPDDIYQQWDMTIEGCDAEKKWQEKYHQYQDKYPGHYQKLQRRLARALPQNFDEFIASYVKTLLNEKPMVATRKASQMTLEHIAPQLPELFGGSADLTGSNLTDYSSSKWLNDSIVDANYLSYGVREFGMAAIMNGISLYGGFRPYGGTFLVFSDYARNAIRMSAIMHQPVIYIMTHDSIGLGEDGPTHQPIEQLPSLRLIPNLNVWRPADAVETAVAWQMAIKTVNSPSLLVLSRQNLPTLISEMSTLPLIRKGGYLLKQAKIPQLTLMATGSELSIAVAAADQLKAEGIAVNIVSMPCVEEFLRQGQAYQESVIVPNIPAIAIEAAQPDLWYRLLPQAGGEVIGLDHFGASAPANQLYQAFGLTADAIVKKAKTLCQLAIS